MTRVVPVLQTARLTLRPVRGGDAETYLAYGRDPEIARMYGVNPDDARPMTQAEAERWLQGMKESFPAWVIDRNGAAIGVIRLHSHVPQDRRARMAMGLFASEHLGQGFGREALRAVLAHGFADEADGGLGLNRVDLRVIEYNERAIRCYRASGFVEEGREREAARLGARFYDDVIMGALARKFG